jgi:hypothetical protein
MTRKSASPNVQHRHPPSLCTPNVTSNLSFTPEPRIRISQTRIIWPNLANNMCTLNPPGDAAALQEVNSSAAQNGPLDLSSFADINCDDQPARSWARRCQAQHSYAWWIKLPAGTRGPDSDRVTSRPGPRHADVRLSAILHGGSNCSRMTLAVTLGY